MLDIPDAFCVYYRKIYFSNLVARYHDKARAIVFEKFTDKIIDEIFAGETT